MKPSSSAKEARKGMNRSLDFLFAPRGVAVVGASERPGSVGRKIVENLRHFGGPVYPINPNHPTILGVQAFPTVASVGARVDLAVIATPAATVPAVMRDCALAGVKGAIILSVGFRECGPEGAQLERQIKEEADRGGIRIVGPNCLGVMAPHTGLNATLAGALAHKGSIAFVSQSGALCAAILDWGYRKKLGFSAFVSVGSMHDVGWGDLIDHLGSDPNTQSIVIYMESIGDARSFLSAAREVAFRKPIIVIKVGRSEVAAKAVATHTGELTVSDEVLDAAFRRVGVLRVDTIEDLFELAQMVGKQPIPKGPRLAIITNAGGPGALAADMLVTRGGQLAQLSPETLAALESALPGTWSHGDPVDVLGDADEQRYAKAVELVANDANNDGILVILTPQVMTNPAATAAAMKPFAKIQRKPVLTSWMGGAEVEDARQRLADLGLPVFEYPDAAARAFCYMWQRSSNLRALYETPTLSTLSAGGSTGRARASQIICAVQRSRRTLLTEFESKQLAAAYGIPTVETCVALKESEAEDAAERIGFPVAVKLHSQTLTHKSEVGGVHLDVRNRAGVRKAWKAIEKSVRGKAGKEHFLGVTVQRLLPRSGYELILGSSVDQQFGPVILFGAGGELVDVFKDQALALPPLTANLARLVIERTKICAAMKGIRGRLPVDLQGLEQVLVRFSQLVAEQPRIKEIELNPLLVTRDLIVALDARVTLHEASVKDADLPRLAIRPYPFHYIKSERLKDGTPITIRPIRAEDEPLMVRFHKELSADTVYNRYFAFLKLEQRIAHDRLARLCFIDYDREMALVAERADPKTGVHEFIGIGRLVKQQHSNSGEFAVLVDDRWQGRGLGSMLLGMLVDVGREEHLLAVTGEILPENIAMKSVARRIGFSLHQPSGEGPIRAEIAI